MFEWSCDWAVNQALMYETEGEKGGSNYRYELG